MILEIKFKNELGPVLKHVGLKSKKIQNNSQKRGRPKRKVRTRDAKTKRKVRKT